VLSLKRKALSAYRGGTVAMIFQDPGLALDPVYRMGRQASASAIIARWRMPPDISCG
jgi:peptide/nickel transport system ATP-binding protein